MEALNDVAGEVDELGATIVVISPQLATYSQAMIEEKKLRFEILQDDRNEVARQYGLRWTVPDPLKSLYLKFGIDLESVNGDDSWTLPLPACFIIDETGMVRYARVHADYTKRPEPADTISALRKLTAE